MKIKNLLTNIKTNFREWAWSTVQAVPFKMGHLENWERFASQLTKIIVYYEGI